MRHAKPLSPLLHAAAKLEKVSHSKSLTIGELLALLEKEGPFAIVFILCIPFLLLIPIPGLSTVFGVIIFFMGVKVIAHQELWLPKRIKKMMISQRAVHKIAQGLSGTARFLDVFTRARMSDLVHNISKKKVSGIFILSLGIFLMVPIPGMNFLPALTAALLSIGYLKRDGLFVFMGYIGFALNIILFIALPVYGFFYFFSN